MKKNLKISHQIIIKYINNDLPENDRNTLNELRTQVPHTELLFSMIDNCMAKVQERTRQGTVTSHGETTLMEKLLPEMLAGSISVKNARLFLTTLQNSVDFYSLLQSKLDSIKTILADQQQPDFPLVSDSELMMLIKSAVRKPSLSFITRSVDKIRQIIGDWTRLRMIKLAFSGLVLILIMSSVYVYFYTNQNVNPVYVQYFNKQNPPFLLTDSSLRGSVKNNESNLAFDALVGEFKMGVSYYLTRDYDKAIRNFNRVLVVSGLQQNTIANEQGKNLLRESYFYAGVSSMALAWEKKANKQQLYQQAIVYLNSAASLVTTSNMKGGDRELFFAGLAYSQVGENELALQSLEAIPDNSSFAKDCKQLKEYLAKK